MRRNDQREFWECLSRPLTPCLAADRPIVVGAKSGLGWRQLWDAAGADPVMDAAWERFLAVAPAETAASRWLLSDS